MTRVEVSLDKGVTWLISNIMRHEEPTEHGKYWCWVFWEVQVPTLDLLRAQEICSRAVDISNNLQPQKYALSALTQQRLQWHAALDLTCCAAGVLFPFPAWSRSRSCASPACLLRHAHTMEM